MRAPSAVAGVDSLRSIAARSSSARVLDLVSIEKDAAANPAHRARPLFSHPVLNRTIVVKHHPAPGEVEFGQTSGPIVTKVIFAFDPGDLDLGGQFIVVGDPDLAGQLARHLDYRAADMGRDLAILRLIDRLPTLDPFLLREALLAKKIDAAPCYFRLSPTDRSQMREFVAHQVETLIDVCFAGALVSPEQAKRLSDLILASGDSPELAPLRRALRMETEQFAQAMFCWKAVLYYRWRSRTLAPQIAATRRAIESIDVSRFDIDTARYVSAAIDRLTDLMHDCERRIAEMFRIYEAVFTDLTTQRTPEPFRRFLIDGPRLFARLGERMGRLEQLVSYWAYQFPEKRLQSLAPEAVYDGLRSLVAALAPPESPWAVGVEAVAAG
ncbi:MAG: hypothetical protein ACREEW_14225 [Caulobacteraceae bacterium]